MDYYIVYDEGELDHSHIVWRVRVAAQGGELIDKLQVDTIERISEDGATENIPFYEEIQNGFGTMRHEAVEDFIRRNKSSILNLVFTNKEE